MNKNQTHISILLDRSGSMEAIRDDVIEGYNTFLREQQQLPGEATWSLTQFDLEDPREVIHWFRPLAKVPRLDRATFVPRAGTPFYDALGWNIRTLDAALYRMPVEERPGKVITAIFSDGHENSSRKFSPRRIARMIEEKQGEGWQFTFQGCDLAGIHEAIACGIPRKSTLAYTANTQGTAAAWKSLSHAISGYRTGLSEDLTYQEIDESSSSEPLNSLLN